MDMVERVARALAAARGMPWDYMHELYTAYARAAIEAMRELSEGMCEAVWDAQGWGDCGGRERNNFEDEWRTAIDAALGR